MYSSYYFESAGGGVDVPGPSYKNLFLIPLKVAVRYALALLILCLREIF
jgi:hypothetical protein